MGEITYTEFNKKDIYDEKISPLVLQIKQICKINKIPFVISTAFSNEKNKTEYCNDGVLPGSNRIVLFNDQLSKQLLVMQGANVSVIQNEYQELSDYIDSQESDDDEDSKSSNDDDMYEIL